MKYSETPYEVLKSLLQEYEKTINKAIKQMGEEQARIIFKKSFDSYDSIKIELLLRGRVTTV